MLRSALLRVTPTLPGGPPSHKGLTVKPYPPGFTPAQSWTMPVAFDPRVPPGDLTLAVGVVPDTIEGALARARDLGAIEALLVAIDDLLVAETLGEEAFAAYVDLNARFHAALIGLAGNPTLAREIERVQALPFAGPSAFVGVQARLPRARSILIEAQSHHRAVVEAIRDREGGRADALMREHARLARRNLQAALTDRERLDGLPGVALIRDAGKRRA